MSEKFGFHTKALLSGWDPEQATTWDVVPPVSVSTIFKQEAPGKFRLGYNYTRYGNPSRNALEENLAALENARYSLVFSSGQAATTNIIHLLKAGDHLVTLDDFYGGTCKIFSSIASKMGITTTYVDGRNAQNVSDAVKDNTRMVWLETPSNPNLKVVDIEKISNLVHKKNSETIVVVDNTFMTPYFQRPLELGADISHMSVSKYINGHHDVLMGAATINSEELYKQLRFLQETMGAVPSPTDCHRVMQNIKTLPLRMLRHMENGLKVAEFLEKHSRVERVNHPLLLSHPQHDLAKKQSTGHSGMLSFTLKGDMENTNKFIASLKLTHTTGSLGGVASTIAVPNLMTAMVHDSSSPGVQKLVDDKLLRISVGLEDINDLLQDLDQALKKAFS